MAADNQTTLKACRAAITVREDLQQLIQQATVEGWTVEVFAKHLQEALPPYLVDDTGIVEVARFLAEEHLRRDPDKILLVSWTTGMPIVQVPADAVYQPAPVARGGEDTGEPDRLVSPLPQLVPEVEAAILLAQHGVETEAVVVQKRAESLPTTDLLRQEGDPRLQVLHSGGRRSLEARLKQELPSLWLEATAPLSNGASLNLDEYWDPITVTVSAAIAQAIDDTLSLNLRHDAYQSLRTRVQGQWLRGLAKQLATAAYLHQESNPVSYLDLGAHGILIADPNVSRVLPGKVSVVVPDVPTVAFQQAPLVSVIPDSYKCAGRDYHKMWQIGAEVYVEIRIPRQGVVIYDIADVPESGLSVEVV